MQPANCWVGFTNTLNHYHILLIFNLRKETKRNKTPVFSACWRTMTLIIVLNLFFGTSLHLRGKETQLKEFCERGHLWRWRSALPLKSCCPSPARVVTYAIISLRICDLRLVHDEHWAQMAARGCLSIMWITWICSTPTHAWRQECTQIGRKQAEKCKIALV